MRRILVFLSTSLLTILALANIAAACGSWGYQPEVPEKLRK
jgi:cyclic lactone autoinducer peptide